MQNFILMENQSIPRIRREGKTMTPKNKKNNKIFNIIT
jgi:hypothetical protein